MLSLCTSSSLIGCQINNLPVHDVSGGWFDAGDYLKFVATTSYVLDVMQITVRDSPNAANADELRSEIQFGTQSNTPAVVRARRSVVALEDVGPREQDPVHPSRHRRWWTNWYVIVFDYC